MKRSELLRNKRDGKLGGVCAGVADYFGMEAWLVRILTITAFLLLAGPFVLVGYIALWLILEDKSGKKSHTYSHKGFVNTQHSSNTSTYEDKGFKHAPFTDHHKVEVKSKVWQCGVPPRQAFIDIKQQYENVENKLRRLESYVTSKEFEINREINRL